MRHADAEGCATKAGVRLVSSGNRTGEPKPSHSPRQWHPRDIQNRIVQIASGVLILIGIVLAAWPWESTAPPIAEGAEPVAASKKRALIKGLIAAAIVGVGAMIPLFMPFGKRAADFKRLIRDFPDGFHTGDNDVWLTRLYRPETASSTIFYVVGLVVGYVPHPKSPGNGSHRAPVSHIESFVSELAYVLLRHSGFSMAVSP